jgi:hypothetical protein
MALAGCKVRLNHIMLVGNIIPAGKLTIDRPEKR